jgi:tetrahydromethanopterin S-methyltransferase subunit B
MKEKDKKEFINIFNEGFEQLILPHFEEIKTRLDKVENRLDDLETTVNKMDRKLDSVVSC